MPHATNISSDASPLCPAWRVLARHHRRGVVLPTHRHRTAQLVFALAGVMSVATDVGRWTVPPQQALWLPPDHAHAIRMLSDTELRTVYFDRTAVAGCAAFDRHGQVHAAVASPLLRALVLGLFDPGRSATMQNLTASLLLHALQASPCAPTHLPWPAAPALRRAADAVVAGEGWDRPLGEVAAAVALSERTFSRHFTADTGLSFRAWRQRARLVASLDLLAAALPVKVIAHRMGYGSPAAYATAFAAHFGCPPEVFRRADGPPDPG